MRILQAAAVGTVVAASNSQPLLFIYPMTLYVLDAIRTIRAIATLVASITVGTIVALATADAIGAIIAIRAVDASRAVPAPSTVYSFISRCCMMQSGR
jgi:hypothetical protein